MMIFVLKHTSFALQKSTSLPQAPKVQRQNHEKYRIMFTSTFDDTERFVQTFIKT